MYQSTFFLNHIQLFFLLKWLLNDYDANSWEKSSANIQYTVKRPTLREKCLYSELFWSVFSRIRTNSEYRHFLRDAPSMKKTQ